MHWVCETKHTIHAFALSGRNGFTNDNLTQGAASLALG